MSFKMSSWNTKTPIFILLFYNQISPQELSTEIYRAASGEKVGGVFNLLHKCLQSVFVSLFPKSSV